MHNTNMFIFGSIMKYSATAPLPPYRDQGVLRGIVNHCVPQIRAIQNLNSQSPYDGPYLPGRGGLGQHIKKVLNYV